jgi:AmiR/NasT family two-component response regulator
MRNSSLCSPRLHAAAILVVSRYSQARDLAAHLEHALQSRAAIDHAIGVIMAESRCDASQAFAALRRVMWVDHSVSA